MKLLKLCITNHTQQFCSWSIGESALVRTPQCDIGAMASTWPNAMHTWPGDHREHAINLSKYLKDALQSIEGAEEQPSPFPQIQTLVYNIPILQPCLSSFGRTLTTPHVIAEIGCSPTLFCFAPEISCLSYFHFEKGALLCMPIRDTILPQSRLNRSTVLEILTSHSLRPSSELDFRHYRTNRRTKRSSQVL